MTLHAFLNASDRSLLDEIREAGLSETEAISAARAVYQYLETNYPVLATISRQVLIGGTANPSETFPDY